MEGRPDIERRDQRILNMFRRGIIRKQIALRLNMQYFTVTKVLQKHDRCRLDYIDRMIPLELS